jgi:hypothetical protein
MPVNTPRDDYNTFTDGWCRLRDAFSGREAVLRAGPKYVPDLPGLDGPKNKAYRQRGVYYNATSRTIYGLMGAIFQKEPEFTIPKQFERWLEDVTLSNVTMEMFALEAGHETLLMGRYGILIDMSIQPPPPAPLIEIRPYTVSYQTEAIINWRTQRIGGDEVLVLVVLKEICMELDAKDPFVLVACEQYRVLSLVNNVYSIQLWRKKPNTNEFIPYGDPIVPSRRGKPLSFIPFVFLAPTHVTPEIAQSPMLDLVDVNLGHWANSVDYEYGLHQVALPTPWVAGVRGGTEVEIKMGPSTVLELELQGSAGMLEFSGQGLGAIMTAMDDKKKMMATLGARMLEAQQKLNETATAVLIRHSSDYANLRTIAQSLEQGFTMALQTMAWWMGTDEKPSDVDAKCELNKEFMSVKVDAQTVQTALTAVQAGEMSFKTFYNILVTGGWAREGVDADQEQKDIEAEGGKASAEATLALAQAQVDATAGAVA